MSISISVSEDPDDVWMMRASLYFWYIQIVSEAFPSNQDVFKYLTIAGYAHGVHLWSRALDNPSFAERARIALQAVATDISNGVHPIPDDLSDGDPASTIEIRSGFSGLAKLLGKHSWGKELPQL